MIEKLCVGDHRSILKIFAKTSCDQMNVYPFNILSCEDAHIEILGIFFSNFNQLILLFYNSFALFKYIVCNPFIFNQIYLFVFPKYDVVYLSRKISN